MRRRRLKKLWKRLGELRRQSNRRDQLMLKLGAAKKDAGRAWFLVEVQIPKTDEELAAHGLTYRLRREKLRQVFRREGRYLLRSNMTSEDPAASVAPLHAAHRNRAGVQGAQAPSCHPAHLPPARGADRGAHLRLVHRLLPARDPEEPRPAKGPRPHPARHRGEVRRVCRWWTSMCRPPTGAIWCWRDIPSRTASTNYSCANCT